MIPTTRRRRPSTAVATVSGTAKTSQAKTSTTATASTRRQVNVHSSVHLTAGVLATGAAWTGTAIGVLITLVVVAAAGVYAWPLRSRWLRRAAAETLDFATATSRAQEVVRADSRDPEVLPEGRTKLLTHGTRTAKAVLLLHGYTVWPDQFATLAQLYFEQGYNVYVPRAPRHGLVDRPAHRQVTVRELVGYANESVNIAAGLGDEVGIVGISGGAVLGTWLAQYRADVVRRLLVLAPFYGVNRAKAPGYLIKPLTVLFGFRILPDRRAGSTNFWLAALSQYLRVKANFQQEPAAPNLISIAVAFSENDDSIDREAAVTVPRKLAEANGLRLGVHRIASEMGLGHDIVRPDRVADHGDELNKIYLALYEGTGSGSIEERVALA